MDTFTRKMMFVVLGAFLVFYIVASESVNAQNSCQACIAEAKGFRSNCDLGTMICRRGTLVIAAGTSINVCSRFAAVPIALAVCLGGVGVGAVTLIARCNTEGRRCDMKVDQWENSCLSNCRNTFAR